jgi:hypothetical protein
VLTQLTGGLGNTCRKDFLLYELRHTEVDGFSSEQFPGEVFPDGIYAPYVRKRTERLAVKSHIDRYMQLAGGHQH